MEALVCHFWELISERDKSLALFGPDVFVVFSCCMGLMVLRHIPFFTLLRWIHVCLSFYIERERIWPSMKCHGRLNTLLVRCKDELSRHMEDSDKCLKFSSQTALSVPVSVEHTRAWAPKLGRISEDERPYQPANGMRFTRLIRQSPRSTRYLTQTRTAGPGILFRAWNVIRAVASCSHTHSVHTQLASQAWQLRIAPSSHSNLPENLDLPMQYLMLSGWSKTKAGSTRPGGSHLEVP